MHVDPGHQRPEPRLVDPAFAHEPLLVEPEPLQPPVEVEARRGRADEQQRAPRDARARTARERLEQLRDRACSR